MGSICALSLLMLLSAVGCGGGGGGSSSGSSSDLAAAIATTPVDLPPGQTSAQFAWDPSEGQVVGYLVFQSNGEEAFEFLGQVVQPQIEINGVAGDNIRILVVAQGVESLRSVASLPIASGPVPPG